MDQSEKVRENRMRRMATRRGLRLFRSPQRDQGGMDFGRYRIETADGHLPDDLRQGRFYPIADLDGVERYLTSPR